MHKVMRPGTIKTWGGRRVSFYIEAEYKDDRLSIHGVIAPTPSGNAIGGCGQIDMEFAHRNPEDNDKRYSHLIHPKDINFAEGWNQYKWLDLLDVWKKWHLNDMQPGCVHQQSEGWGNKELTLSNGEVKLSGWVYPKEHPEGVLTKPCPTCGYKYGTAWHKKTIPNSVILFIQSLPDTDRQPAWI